MSQENPELEQAIRREVIRQLANVKPPATTDYSIDEWDFKCESLDIHPGQGWVMHSAHGPDNHGRVYVVWRINRQLQLSLKMAPSIKLPHER